MPVDTPLTAILAMAVFGFTGSLHCAAMCGTLAASACGSVQATGDARSRRFGFAQYHLTRIFSYAVLGLAAGLTTAMVLAHRLAAASHYLGIAFGLLMTTYASLELVRSVHNLRSGGQSAPGQSPWHSWRGPEIVARQADRLHRGLSTLPFPRPVTLGIATAFLPCGFLLAALLQAALLANPVHGAMAMAAFAIASSPALLAGSGILASVNRLAPRLAPLLAALLLLASSLVVVWRAGMPPHQHDHQSHQLAPGH